jgi:hypothetical protein
VPSLQVVQINYSSVLLHLASVLWQEGPSPILPALKLIIMHLYSLLLIKLTRLTFLPHLYTRSMQGHTGVFLKRVHQPQTLSFVTIIQLYQPVDTNMWSREINCNKMFDQSETHCQRGMLETYYYLTNRFSLKPFSRLSSDQNGAFWWGTLMKGQLMHSTKMHHFGPMIAEKMALTRIYKRVSYIPLMFHCRWITTYQSCRVYSRPLGSYMLGRGRS